MKENFIMKLSEYIDQNFSSKAEFAELNGVKQQQVTQWINKGFVVFDDKLYSKRRDLVQKTIKVTAKSL